MEVVELLLSAGPHQLGALILAAWMFGSQVSPGNSQAQHARRCERPLRSSIIQDNAAVIGIVLPLQASQHLETYFASGCIWSGFYFLALWSSRHGGRLAGFPLSPPCPPNPIP